MSNDFAPLIRGDLSSAVSHGGLVVFSVESWRSGDCEATSLFGRGGIPTGGKLGKPFLFQEHRLGARCRTSLSMQNLAGIGEAMLGLAKRRRGELLRGPRRLGIVDVPCSIPTGWSQYRRLLAKHEEVLHGLTVQQGGAFS